MRKRTIALGLAAAACLSLFGCVNVVLPAVPNRVVGPDPRPAIDLSDPDATRAQFEQYVYGAMPPAPPLDVVAHEVIAESAFNDLGRVEQVTLRVASEDQLGDRGVFNLAIAIPKNADGPVPVIVMQVFGGVDSAFDCLPGVGSPHAGPRDASGDDCWDGGFQYFMIHAIFGKYASGPPFEDLLAEGYAVAIMAATDVFPDRAEAGINALERTAAPEGPRWGAIAAWAWLYSRTIDYLESDDRFDPDRMAIWGHSRNGKSVVVAMAWDPRIDAGIAHQSGTGGATLSRSYNGESVAKITEDYPHWFTPAYAEFAGREEELPVDQHQLLALIAPRPILLGNSIRDAWSDPEGAYRAAMAADAAYEAQGSEGLDQDSMRAANLSADIAFFTRPGRHGVTVRDWEYFREFLGAHF